MPQVAELLKQIHEILEEERKLNETDALICSLLTRIENRIVSVAEHCERHCESTLIESSLLDKIESRRLTIRRAQQIAQGETGGVVWRDLLPPEFFVPSQVTLNKISIQGEVNQVGGAIHNATASHSQIAQGQTVTANRVD